MAMVEWTVERRQWTAPGGGRRRTGFFATAADPAGADDYVSFVAEDEGRDESLLPPWRVLVVDDDLMVHEVTRVALEDVRIGGRPLDLVDAYSAAEARSLLVEHIDIDLVLLDVVMETPDAGLRLVPEIRALERPWLRVVLRTGQPGYAPEATVRAQYPVDGYLLKSSLTRDLLLDTLNGLLVGPPEMPGAGH